MGEHVMTPAVRVVTAPCQFCGDVKEAGGKNYSYPDSLIPGNAHDPNTEAAKEAQS